MSCNEGKELAGVEAAFLEEKRTHAGGRQSLQGEGGNRKMLTAQARELTGNNR